MQHEILPSKERKLKFYCPPMKWGFSAKQNYAATFSFPTPFGILHQGGRNLSPFGLGGRKGLHTTSYVRVDNNENSPVRENWTLQPSSTPMEAETGKLFKFPPLLD